MPWPDADRLSRKDGLTAGDLRQAFVMRSIPAGGANRSGVGSAGGWLRECSCATAGLHARAPASARAFGPPDDVPLKIWRGL
jgi:ribonuclease T2